MSAVYLDILHFTAEIDAKTEASSLKHKENKEGFADIAKSHEQHPIKTLVFTDKQMSHG